MDNTQEMDIWGECLDKDLSGDALHEFLLEKCGGQNESYRNIMELMGFDSDETLTPPEENFIATMISEENAVETETRIEGFDIIEEVGRGGMGVILKAYDLDMGRTVAVKVLREKHRHNQYVINRFSLEPRIAGHISHTGIPPVYSHGMTDDGRPYFAMKLIEGHTLSEIMKDDCCKSDSRLLGIFRGVCATMAYAHECGIVNLDLKSQNVMVGKFGEVQVTDWGISQRFAGGDGPISFLANDIDDDQIVGTVGVMPPEQVKGDRDLIKSPSCDVYSLGVMLGQILTCDRRATDASLRDSLLANCEASETLVDASMKCIQKEQGDRYGDASELLEVIDYYMATQRARRKDAEVKLAAEEKAFVKLWSAFLVVLIALVVSVWAFFSVHKATSSLRMANKGLSEANVRLRSSLHTTHAMLASDSLESRFMPRKLILELIKPVKRNSLARKLLNAKLNRGILEYRHEVAEIPKADYVKEGQDYYLVSGSVEKKSFVCSKSGKLVGLQSDLDDGGIDWECMKEVEPMGKVSCVFYNGEYAICGTDDGSVAVYITGDDGLSLDKVLKSDVSPIREIKVKGGKVTYRSENRVTVASLEEDIFEEKLTSSRGTHSTSRNGKYTLVNCGAKWSKLYDNQSGEVKWGIDGCARSKWFVSDSGNNVVCATIDHVKLITNGVVSLTSNHPENSAVADPIIDTSETHFYTALQLKAHTWDILRWSIETGESESIATVRGKPIFALAEDGLLVFAVQNKLIGIDANESSVEKTIREFEGKVTSVEPTESRFAMSDKTGAVSVWGLSEDGILSRSRLFNTDIKDITDVSLSKVGEVCIIISETGGAWMHDTESGERIIFLDEDMTKASFACHDSSIYTQDSGTTNNAGVKRWTTE